jgi:hypothetical protein
VNNLLARSSESTGLRRHGFGKGLITIQMFAKEGQKIIGRRTFLGKNQCNFYHKDRPIREGLAKFYI